MRDSKRRENKNVFIYLFKNSLPFWSLAPLYPTIPHRTCLWLRMTASIYLEFQSDSHGTRAKSWSVQCSFQRWACCSQSLQSWKLDRVCILYECWNSWIPRLLARPTALLGRGYPHGRWTTTRHETCFLSSKQMPVLPRSKTKEQGIRTMREGGRRGFYIFVKLNTPRELNKGRHGWLLLLLLLL